MQIAKFQLNDGRIAKFEVPDNITPEEAYRLVAPEIAKLNALSETAMPKLSATTAISE